MNRKRWIQIGLLFNPLLLFTIAAFSQSREARYAYFFNASEYIKVEISTHRTVAHGSLYDYAELSELLPQFGCDLLHYDPNTERCYFIADQPEAHVVGDKVQILVVALPDFKLVRQMKLDQSTIGQINTLLTPDGKRLFISYQQPDEKNLVFVREVYDTQSFKLLETKKAVIPRDKYTPEAGLGIKFSDKARISDDGETIYDLPDSSSARPPAFGGSEYVITGEHVTQRNRPDWPSSIKDFRTKNPDFQVSWSSQSPARVVFIKTTQREYTHWDRDSETGELRPLGKTTTTYTDGILAYYGELTGGKVKEFHIEQLAGFMPDVLGVTPDGRIAYFSNRPEKGQRQLFAVDLALGKAVKINLFGITPGLCIFADR